MDSRQSLNVVIAATGGVPSESLHHCLRENRFVEIIGTTSSVEETRAFLGMHHVDLLFADVDLPGGGGFALVRSLVTGQRPDVIFTANDDSHAIEAFRYQPLDFVVYPAGADRIDDAIARALDQVLVRRLEEGDRSIQEMFSRAKHGVQSVLRLMVKTAGRISFVKAEDIDWVEAERDYVRIYNAGKKHLLREKISHLEQQLPQGRFLRIHRSTIVNIDRIKELQPLSFGEYSVILHDGTRLTMSRSFRDRVFERLQSAA
jgi:two-component system, LytTR family, response regulator